MKNACNDNGSMRMPQFCPEVCVCPTGACVLRDASGSLNDSLPLNFTEACDGLSCSLGWNFTECQQSGSCAFGLSNNFQVNRSAFVHPYIVVYACQMGWSVGYIRSNINKPKHHSTRQPVITRNVCMDQNRTGKKRLERQKDV